MAGRLIEIVAECGGCKKRIIAANVSIESEEGYRCWGCRNNSKDFYTCMCETDNHSLEFSCPKCKFYNSISF